MKHQCRNCTLWKRTKEFYRNAKSKLGIDTTCKSCRNEAIKKRKEANPEPVASPKRQKLGKFGRLPFHLVDPNDKELL